MVCAWVGQTKRSKPRRACALSAHTPMRSAWSFSVHSIVDDDVSTAVGRGDPNVAAVGRDDPDVAAVGRDDPDVAAVGRGEAVLVIHDFATPGECEQLIACAVPQAARLERELLDGAWETDQSARSSIAGLMRLQVVGRLDSGARDLTDALVARTLGLVQRELPRLGEQMLRCDASEILGLPQEPGLEYSTGEPAVNVYTIGGGFKVHEDKQCFTVIIPLNSEADGAFTGGGTTFWRPDHRHEAREGLAEPALVLAPPAGSAIVFGGTVTHAARPVTWGTRCVWVASFSPKGCVPRDEADEAEAQAPAVYQEAWLQARGLKAVDEKTWAEEQEALTRAMSRMYGEGGAEEDHEDDEEEYDPNKDPPIDSEETAVPDSCSGV